MLISMGKDPKSIENNLNINVNSLCDWFVLIFERLKLSQLFLYKTKTKTIRRARNMKWGYLNKTTFKIHILRHSP